MMMKSTLHMENKISQEMEDGAAGGGFGCEPHAKPWPVADSGHVCYFQKELL